VYRRENVKIRKALKDKDPGRATAVVVRSRALEGLFELERVHLAAALSVQRCWKRYRARCYWQLMIKQSRAVRKIQRVTRGMLARTLLRVWLLRRSWLVIVSQACIRGYLTRKRVRAQQALERACVGCLQATVRGYLARIRVDFVRSERAAVAIQRVWRGATSRVASDRRWLDGEVTKVQRLVRGHLGRIWFATRRAEMVHAAVLLQRCIRACFAQWRCYDLLWHRETERKREFARVLRAEDEYWVERHEQLVRHIKENLKMEEQLRYASDQCEALQEEVIEKEFDLLEMEHERKLVDRRAVQQGWTAELDRYIKEHRRWTTHAKFEYIFVGATYLRDLEQRMRELQEELEWVAFKSDEAKRLRDEEVHELQERERVWNDLRSRRAHRRAVADQRRRWQVPWFTADGKADKKRRNGHAWDPSVFAGPEREVFSIGAVNLLAGSAASGAGQSGLELALEQVALQNSQNQIVQHGALMKPLMEGMEKLTSAVAQLSLRTQMQRDMDAALAAQVEQDEFDIRDIDIENLGL
jgi:hypothetical protein